VASQKSPSAKVGCDGVHISIDGDPKKCFTGIAAVTAANQKLPLMLVASGKTTRTEDNFGDVRPHWTAHSESGWATKEAFSKWLETLRRWLGDADPATIVLDCCSVHQSDDIIKLLALELGFRLAFMSPGTTDESAIRSIARFRPAEGNGKATVPAAPVPAR
jgi:hypothetical protein